MLPGIPRVASQCAQTRLEELLLSLTDHLSPLVIDEVQMVGLAASWLAVVGVVRGCTNPVSANPRLYWSKVEEAEDFHSAC